MTEYSMINFSITHESSLSSLPPSLPPSLELKGAAGSPHLPEHLKALAPIPVPARLGQPKPESGVGRPQPVGAPFAKPTGGEGGEGGGGRKRDREGRKEGREEGGTGRGEREGRGEGREAGEWIKGVVTSSLSLSSLSPSFCLWRDAGPPRTATHLCWRGTGVKGR